MKSHVREQCKITELQIANVLQLSKLFYLQLVVLKMFSQYVHMKLLNISLASLASKLIPVL
jgi:hypothetical protein